MVFLALFVLAILALCVIIRRRQKSRATHEQPFYDYVVFPDPHILPERIQQQDRQNDAYGAQPQTTSPQVTPLHHSVAYSIEQSTMEEIQLKENDAYGTKVNNNYWTTSMQPNVAYGVVETTVGEVKP